MGFFDKLFRVNNQEVVNWYCDNCGAHMNNQVGFTTKNGRYTCKICGYNNDVSPNNIEPDYFDPNWIEYKASCPGSLYDQRVASVQCKFNWPISKERFEQMAVACGNGINRLKIRVNGATVTGVVTTVSGTNDWRFGCDFNDCGEITGNVLHFWSDNQDSKIPKTYILRLIDAIVDVLKLTSNYKPQREFICPFCGDNLRNQSNSVESCFYWKCRICGNGFELPLHPRGGYDYIAKL